MRDLNIYLPRAGQEFDFPREITLSLSHASLRFKLPQFLKKQQSSAESIANAS